MVFCKRRRGAHPQLSSLWLTSLRLSESVSPRLAALPQILWLAFCGAGHCTARVVPEILVDNELEQKGLTASQ